MLSARSNSLQGAESHRRTPFLRSGAANCKQQHLAQLSAAPPRMQRSISVPVLKQRQRSRPRAGDGNGTGMFAQIEGILSQHHNDNNDMGQSPAYLKFAELQGCGVEVAYHLHGGSRTTAVAKVSWTSSCINWRSQTSHLLCSSAALEQWLHICQSRLEQPILA